jgi:DNA polymerase-3 subunit beta
MKGSFTAPGGALAAAVKFTARWLDPKPSVPAHGGILFDVADGILSVTGFNENATARASLPVESGLTSADGQFVVAGRLIDQLVATFPDRPVTLEQDGSMVVVTAGKFRATLPVMSEDDYPDRPGEAPFAGRVSGDEFAAAVRRVGVAASRDYANSLTVALAGIHLAMRADRLTLTTTDRYRSARIGLEWEPSDEGTALGNDSLVFAQALIDSADVFEGGMVRIGWTKGSFSLTSPDRSLVMSEIGSVHPTAENDQIFQYVPTEVAVVDVRDAAQPLKRADLLNGREGDHVRLDFRAGTLGFRVHTEISDGGEEIDVEYDGPDCSLIVKSPFFRAALDSTPGGVAHVGFTPGPDFRPIVITSPADPSWRHYLAQLRK